MAATRPDGSPGDGSPGTEGASTQPHGALGQGRQVLVRELEVDGVWLERPGPTAYRRMGMDHAKEPDVTPEEPVPVRATRRRGEREGSLTEGLELHHARQMIQRVVEESRVVGIDLDPASKPA